MRGTRSFLRYLLIFSLFVGQASQVLADNKKNAAKRSKEFFRQAEVHFRLGEFKEALKDYKEAYRIHPLPEFLFNIGQAHRHLKDCDRAVFFYRQFLTQRPKSSHRPKITKLIAKCEEQSQRKPKDPSTKPRQQPSQQTKPRVETKGPSTVVIKGPSTVVIRGPSNTDKGAVTPQKAPPEPRAPLSRVWFWTGVGVTTALFATATVTGLMSSSRNTEYLDPSTGLERRQELRDSGRTLEVVSWTCVGVGAAAAATTAVLFWLSSGARQEQATSSAPSVSAIFDKNGAAIVLGGRF